ncbi:gamma carbonic anhydrase family protein [Euzebya tangerina]|uniref:gamma carbonic anhydrase family protein n=1 Tax=Euzebya tangerina TaxID=591198 RepID=UPI000E318CCA|nr:gamma carbonic anhydrase family protein [Euzebya tangerina]
MAHIITVDGRSPDVSAAKFIAPTAVITGDVTLEEGVSIWFGTVIRAEYDPVVIGRNSNVQDNTVIHTDRGQPVIVGENVTVGHRALLHGTQIESGVLVGMGAILLNGSRIGADGLVAAGALVREGMEVGPRQLTVGVPAKARDLPEQLQPPWSNVDDYLALADLYES